MTFAEKIVRQAARRLAETEERALRETTFALGLLGIPFDRNDIAVSVSWGHLDCGPAGQYGVRSSVTIRWRPGADRILRDAKEGEVVRWEDRGGDEEGGRGMKLIDGEALLAWIEGRFLGDEEELARFISGCEVEAAIRQSIDARPSPIRLLAEHYRDGAPRKTAADNAAGYGFYFEDEPKNEDVEAYVAGILDALADELGEPPLEEPRE